MVLDRLRRMMGRGMLLQGWRPVPVVVVVFIIIYALAFNPRKTQEVGKGKLTAESVLSSLLGTDLHNRKLLDVNQGKMKMHDLLSIATTTPKQPRYTGSTTVPTRKSTLGEIRKQTGSTTSLLPIRPVSLSQMARNRFTGTTDGLPLRPVTPGTPKPKSDEPILPVNQQAMPKPLLMQQPWQQQQLLQQQAQQQSVQQQAQQQLLQQQAQQQLFQQQQPLQQQQNQQIQGLLPSNQMQQPNSLLINRQQAGPMRVTDHVVFQPQQGDKMLIPAHQVSVDGLPLVNNNLIHKILPPKQQQQQQPQHQQSYQLPGNPNTESHGQAFQQQQFGLGQQEMPVAQVVQQVLSQENRDQKPMPLFGGQDMQQQQQQQQQPHSDMLQQETQIVRQDQLVAPQMQQQQQQPFEMQQQKQTQDAGQDQHNGGIQMQKQPSSDMKQQQQIQNVGQVQQQGGLQVQEQQHPSEMQQQQQV